MTSEWYNLLGGNRLVIWSEERWLIIVDYRIAGSRIIVWDVLHHLENDWPPEEIAEVLGLSNQQVHATVD